MSLRESSKPYAKSGPSFSPKLAPEMSPPASRGLFCLGNETGRADTGRLCTGECACG